VKILLIIVIAACTVPAAENAFYGDCSYYHDKYDGRKTASGLIFRQKYNYAAHRTLPFGTIVKVINLHNQRSARVIIVDRGPYSVELAAMGILAAHPARIIDVSRGTAILLGMIKDGVVPVKIIIIKYGASK
jgi:rare lipoprotein A